jgi:hypothetical protein
VLLVSDVLAVPQSLLGIIDAPANPYWTTAELISYLNNFISDACGRRRDLFTIREFVPLQAGTDQVLPDGGIQFLDAHYTGTGNAVFVKDLADGKHTYFKTLGAMTPVVDVQVVCSDVRDRRRYHVFPGSTGAPQSTLEITFGAVPDLLNDSSLSQPYPLDPDTLGAANDYIMALAYDKMTERRDEIRSKAYMARYEAWIGANIQAQLAQQVKED